MTFAMSHICSLKMTTDWSIKARMVREAKKPRAVLFITLLQMWKLMPVYVFAGCYNYLFRMQALDAIRDSGKTLFCLCTLYITTIKFRVSNFFSSYFVKKSLCSSRLHLFDQNTGKTVILRNIIAIEILCPVMEKLHFLASFL